MTTRTTPFRNKSDLVAMAVVLLVAVVPFLQVVDFDFVNYDDPDYVTDNAMVKAGLTAKGIAWAFTTGHMSNWHPLTWMSHMIDCSLFGLNAGQHHLTSVVLHGANAILLYLLLRLTTREPYKSALVAALFALHPLHVESVAWIAERKDVLSGAFWLGTMLFYYRYSVRRTARSYALVALCFVLGLMAKPMLVTLPFVLLLTDVWPLRRFAWQPPAPVRVPPPPKKKRKDAKTAPPAQQSPAPVDAIPLKRLIVEKVPLLGIAVASSIVTFVVQQRGGSVGSLQAWPLGMRVTNAVASYGIYLFETFVPVNLAVFYPLPTQTPWVACALSLFCIGAITALSIATRKKHPYLLTGWLWYLGTLVPVIGLVQIGIQAFADRYTYLPSIGLFVMLVWGGEALLGRLRVSARAGAVAAAAILMALSPVTWAQVAHWRNNETLYLHAVAVADNNYVALTNLGHHYGQTGDWAKAIECYEKALAISPNAAKIHFNLGHALDQTGQAEAAVPHYAATLAANPRYPMAHFNMGVALAKLGRNGEAMNEYTQELEINPASAGAHNNLGTLLAKQGRLDEALDHYTSALRLDPQADNTYSNMAVVLLNQGKVTDAVEACTTALRINPLSSDAHNNLGRALEAQGKSGEAIAHFREAVRLDPKSALAQKNLRRAQEANKGP